MDYVQRTFPRKLAEQRLGVQPPQDRPLPTDQLIGILHDLAAAPHAAQGISRRVPQRVTYPLAGVQAGLAHDQRASVAQRGAIGG
jgi:hypothetical protein